MLSLKILADHHLGRIEKGKKKKLRKLLPVGMIETWKFMNKKTIAGVGMNAGVCFFGGDGYSRWCGPVVKLKQGLDTGCGGSRWVCPDAFNWVSWLMLPPSPLYNALWAVGSDSLMVGGSLARWLLSPCHPCWAVASYIGNRQAWVIYRCQHHLLQIKFFLKKEPCWYIVCTFVLRT